ncbi:hypothetical protein BWI97_23285 [Siphonobacter sp. BAB-5405]|nr:hypothetical protein BWI97_23285 [Siphonobacter sp. BAB-5405]
MMKEPIASSINPCVLPGLCNLFSIALFLYSMKPSILLLGILFQQAVWAQSDRVAGVLAQLPADNQTQLHTAMGEVGKLNEEGLLALAAGLNAPGDHTQTEYALGGYTAYASNRSADRMKSSRAYQKALQQATTPEAKAFLIAQLQMVGKEEAVATLASFLGDNRQADPAARALVQINTPSARQALLTALKTAQEPAQLYLIEAIGKTRTGDAVPVLTQLAQNASDNAKKLALYALANIGNPGSGALLARAAADRQYTFEASNATASYLLWIKRVGEAGHTATAEKAARALIEAASQPSQQATRLAAEQLFIPLSKDLTANLQRLNHASYTEPQRLVLLQKSMDVARTPQQRQEILREVGSLRQYAALSYAASFLNHPVLRKPAAEAVAQIALAEPRFNNLEVREWLQKGLPYLSQPATLEKHLAGLPQLFTLTEAEKQEGFKVLFDGSDLEQWTGNKEDYVIKDQNLVIEPTGKGQGNLYTKDEYADFVFRFDFQLTPGANNGLGIRAPLEGDAAYTGMELQILDNTADQYKNLQPYQYHGSVYGIIPAKREGMKPVGQWNTEEVTVRGTRVKVVLNGVTILDGDVAEASQNGTPDHKEHPGLKRTSGHIGFLGHGSVVRFRNIRVKAL